MGYLKMKKEKKKGIFSWISEEILGEIIGNILLLLLRGIGYLFVRMIRFIWN